MNFKDIDIPELIHLLCNPSKQIRNDATNELISRGIYGFNAVKDLTFDKSWIIRYRACEIIGTINTPDAYSILKRMLKDPKDHVRYMAIKGIASLNNTDCYSHVLRMKYDINPFVRRIAEKITKEFENKKC